jgi:hypothetical protein
MSRNDKVEFSCGFVIILSFERLLNLKIRLTQAIRACNNDCLTDSRFEDVAISQTA